MIVRAAALGLFLLVLTPAANAQPGLPRTQSTDLNLAWGIGDRGTIPNAELLAHDSRCAFDELCPGTSTRAQAEVQAGMGPEPRHVNVGVLIKAD